MSRPVTVSEAQNQLLETASDLYRIMQRLHHQHEGMKVQYETPGRRIGGLGSSVSQRRSRRSTRGGPG